MNRLLLDYLVHLTKATMIFLFAFWILMAGAFVLFIMEGRSSQGFAFVLLCVSGASAIVGFAALSKIACLLKDFDV